MASNFVLALAAEAVLLGAYTALFGAGLPSLPGLLPVLLLGTLGLAAAGSMAASLAAQARSREALVPVLLFPLLLPVLLSALPASIHALRGDALMDFAPELQLLAGYDLLVVAASWVLFDFVVEA
jgi:heme exporter protein B